MVSVVMITYGHEAFIEDAINGVLMQEVNFPVELIIADDCSPDYTNEKVALFSNHTNAHWIRYTRHESNIGMMPNFTWALRQARGKYIALCEGDDYWTDPLKLQKQVEFLEANEEYVAVAENGLVINTITNEEYFFSEESERDVTIKEMVSKRRFPTASVVLRNSVLKEYFIDVKYSIDTILWCYLAQKGKFRYFPRVTSVYNRGPHGIVEGTDKFIWAQNVEKLMTEIIRLFGGNCDIRCIALKQIHKHYWLVLKDRNIDNYFDYVICVYKYIYYKISYYFIKLQHK